MTTPWHHSTVHLRKAHHVLALLQMLEREHPDYRPSVRELAMLAGMSTAGTQRALATLRARLRLPARYSRSGRAADRTIRLVETTY